MKTSLLAALILAFPAAVSSKECTCSDEVLSGLIALYHATGGPYWEDKKNWLNVDEDPCSGDWEGVTAKSDVVVKIDLENNGLVGTIPVEFGLITDMTEFRLSKNELAGSIPTQVGNLINVKKLRLYDNALTGAIPSEFGRMTEVGSGNNEFKLYSNDLCGEIPPEVSAISGGSKFSVTYGNNLGTDCVNKAVDTKSPIPSPTSAPIPRPTSAPVPKPTAHPIATPVAEDDESSGGSGTEGDDESAGSSTSGDDDTSGSGTGSSTSGDDDTSGSGTGSSTSGDDDDSSGSGTDTGSGDDESAGSDDTEGGTSGAGGKTCFSGDDRVLLESGEMKPFRDLAVGDSILSADREGELSYSSVVFLPHGENDRRATFVEIITEAGKSLKLTRGHLLPLCDGSLKAANDIKKGSCLRTVDGEDEVLNTTIVDMNGIYTAVTENEFLVVNGIIASPFAASGALVHAFYNVTDMEDWCASNDWLAFENARHPHMQELMVGSKPSKDCLTMLENMFENFKDEPVGWGVDGFGYRNNWINPATPEVNAKKEKTMAFKLAGWN